MDRKKTALIVLSALIAIVSAGIMTGAISFNPMPTLFNEFWSGSIDNTSYTLESWSLDIVDPDTMRIYLNGTAQVSADYVFLVSIMDNTGLEVQNATRTISLTSGKAYNPHAKAISFLGQGPSYITQPYYPKRLSSQFSTLFIDIIVTAGTP